MFKKQSWILLATAVVIAWSPASHGKRSVPSFHDFARMQPDDVINGFQIKHVYRNERGLVVGAKLVHLETDAPLYYLQIQTVPQMFMWVRAPDFSNRGLPHALEHLLAGKGTKGRSVHLLTDMLLAQEGAATYEDFVYYHFDAPTGVDGFFKEFHAWLEALYKPDFSDLEAEREFYHFAAEPDGVTHQLHLIEKGTVYDEMQSGQGKYDYYYGLRMMVLGPHNPLSYKSGGDPQDMRQVTPAMIRAFYKSHYRLGPGTGFILAVDPTVSISKTLAHIDHELQTFSQASDRRAAAQKDLDQVGVAEATKFFLKNKSEEDETASDPAPAPAPASDATSVSAPDYASDSWPYPIEPSTDTTVKEYAYPSQSADDPGHVAMAWKVASTHSATDLKLFELFMHGLAAGHESDLYSVLVDSKTQKLRSGATEVWGGVATAQGVRSPYGFIDIDGVHGQDLTTKLADRLRQVVMQEISMIAHWKSDDLALKTFNEHVLAYLKSWRRSLYVWTKSPPRFGSYDSGDDWKAYFETLELDPSFSVSIAQDEVWDSVENKLRQNPQVWRDVIAQFSLEATPFAVISVPSPKRQEDITEAAKARQLTELKALQKLYHANSASEALAAFKKDEDEKTMAIARAEKSVPVPLFTRHPPLVHDAQIRYRQTTLAGRPAVFSFFKNDPTLDVHFAFDLSHVPPRLQRYLYLLPSLLFEMGLKEDGHVVSYAELERQIHANTYDLSASFHANPVDKKYDLRLNVSGTTPDELEEGFDLLKRITQNNDVGQDNIVRLRDILKAEMVADARFTKNGEGWIDNPVNAFKYQNDALYFWLRSQFTQAHMTRRLWWRLHDSVTPDEIGKLKKFADEKLANMTDRRSIVAALSSDKSTGLNGELIHEWLTQIPLLPDDDVVQGLKAIVQNIVDDLRAGPSEILSDLQRLQRLVINKQNLAIDGTIDEALFDTVKPTIVATAQSFNKSIDSNMTRERAPTEAASYPVWSHLRARLGNSTIPDEPSYPIHLSLVNDEGTTGNAEFLADFPDYRKVSSTALVDRLASAPLEGGGPHSLFMKTWEAGLAYSNGVATRPFDDDMEYYAERVPSFPPLTSLVWSRSHEASDELSVDYAYAQCFGGISRAGDDFSSRGTAMALDLRDGRTPESVRRYTTSLLRLRRRAGLRSLLQKRATQALMPILLSPQPPSQDSQALQRRAHSIFFFVGPKSILQGGERWARGTFFYRLWPSDYWID